MMIKSIIVDDERKHRETTRMLLETYCPNVEIVAEAKDKNSIFEVLSEYKPDLVFLDINLGSSTAFDVLDKLNGNIDFKIVFITASDRYAVEGYKYNAVDYLLKPIKVDNLIKVVERVEKQLTKTSSTEIVLDEIMELYGDDITSLKISITKTGSENVLKIKDVLYCKSTDDKTVFKLFDGSEIVISKKIEHFEQKLKFYKFQRIHPSYMVNSSQILRVLENDNESVLVSNNEKLPLATIYKQEVLDLLTND